MVSNVTAAIARERERASGQNLYPSGILRVSIPSLRSFQHLLARAIAARGLMRRQAFGGAGGRVRVPQRAPQGVLCNA
eukprot:8642840-Lingulodinium_polyedra.AAC.1